MEDDTITRYGFSIDLRIEREGAGYRKVTIGSNSNNVKFQRDVCMSEVFSCEQVRDVRNILVRCQCI